VGITCFFHLHTHNNFIAKAVDATYWRKDDALDIKRRKEAEFLVETDIPTTAIIGWIVYNEEAKKRLLSMEISEKKIFVKTACYF
jgi:hypothetical protein